MRIAQPAGKQLQPGAVGKGPENSALLRIMHGFPFPGDKAQAHIADAPVNASGRPYRDAGQTMTGKSGVDVESPTQGGCGRNVRGSGCQCIFQPVNARRSGQVYIPFVNQQSAQNIRNRRIETGNERVRPVGYAVGVGILNAIESLLDRRQITPVPRPVFVEIGHPFVLVAQLRSHDLHQKRFKVMGRFHRERVKPPIRVLSYVQQAHRPARPGNENLAGVRHVDGNGVLDQVLGGVHGKNQTGCGRCLERGFRVPSRFRGFGGIQLDGRFGRKNEGQRIRWDNGPLAGVLRRTACGKHAKKR